MFMASSRDELKNAAAKLKEMSPKPMDTMFEKQSKTEALKKRLERSQIVTKDVPPTTPGNFSQFCCISYIKVSIMSNFDTFSHLL